MDVELLGQACTLARCPSGVSVLTDPWFSGPAHLGGWYPVPHVPGAELEAVRAQAETASHLYVSHAHEDHFDPSFLRSLARKTILAPAFASSRFREAIEALGAVHDVRWCADGERIALAPEVAATIHLEKPPWRTNSVLVLDAPGGRYVDANDCGLSTELLSAIADERAPSLFAYTLNFAANGYPFPYLRGSLAERRARIQAVRDEIVGAFRTAIGVLSPKVSLAFAGPVTYADAESAFLDEAPEALDWSAMVAELGGSPSVVTGAPGSRISLAGSRVETVMQPWSFGPTVRVDPALDPVLAAPTPSPEDLVAAAHRLAARLASLVRRLPSRATTTALVLGVAPSLAALEALPELRFVIPPGGPARPLRPSEALPSPRLELATLGSILVRFCDGEVDYDAILLSLRARLGRDPDAFDGRLHELLRFGHDPGCVEAMERAERGSATLAEETILVEHAGRRFEVPRRCPHEGELLDGAAIDESGCLVCPRHRWAFELSTGRCVRGDRRVRLDARPIPGDP